MIKLEVGQKVKLRNGDIAEVLSYIKNSLGCNFVVKNLNNNTESTYTSNGKFWWFEQTSNYDVVKILEEEEEMEVKARYFEDGNLMFIQNVKESSIMVLDAFHNVIISVMDYGSPIKAKEQMYTYATLLEVEEVKSH